MQNGPQGGKWKVLQCTFIFGVGWGKGGTLGGTKKRKSPKNKKKTLKANNSAKKKW